MNRFVTTSLLISTFVFSHGLLANKQSVAEKRDVNNLLKKCFITESARQADEVTLGEIKNICKVNVERDLSELTEIGNIGRRIMAERQTQWNPFSIMPHKRNYIFPIQISNKVNEDPYKDVNDWSEHLEKQESKFQLSIKVPLNSADIFAPFDGLYFGFTLQAWWQVYADEISKPFRETNYQPEVYYLSPIQWHPFGSNIGLGVGAEHQSNGRAGLLSRSWNRTYGFAVIEKGNYATTFRIEHRIKERQKNYPTESSGDDNPGIVDKLGQFQWTFMKAENSSTYSITWRHNKEFKNGSVRINYSLPLFLKMKGYIEYFNGYGEGLINYDRHQQNIGLGFLLTDLI